MPRNKSPPGMWRMCRCSNTYLRCKRYSLDSFSSCTLCHTNEPTAQEWSQRGNFRSSLKQLPRTSLPNMVDMPSKQLASRFHHCMIGRPVYVVCTLYRNFRTSSSETSQRGTRYNSLRPREAFQRDSCVNTRQRLRLQTILRRRSNKTTAAIVLTARVKTSIRYRRVENYLNAT